MRIGVVDVGSNTVHLSIIDGARGTPPLPTYSTKARLLLAESVRKDGSMAPDAVDELVQTLRRATSTCRDHQVDEQLVFATAVVRDAANGDEILGRVRREADVDLQLLTGEQEARFTYSAARRWFGWSSGPMVVLDIGGGSLELAAGRNELPTFAVSYPLGAGRLTRDWLPDERASNRQLRRLRDHVRDETRDAVVRLRWEGESRFAVGTSKTFKQLARLAGAAPEREGPFVRRRLSLDDLKRWEGRLSRMRAQERAGLRGVSKRRSRQILAGGGVGPPGVRGAPP